MVLVTFIATVRFSNIYNKFLKEFFR